MWRYLLRLYKDIMMRNRKPRRLKKRIIASNLATAISNTLVLFLIGLLALMLINANRLADYAREKIGFTLVLKEDVKEVEILRLQKLLNSTNFVKSTRYVDKQTAASELQAELGEEFTGFLGFNPLYASLDVKLIAEFTRPENLAFVEKKFLEFPEVKEVYYQRNLVTLINENTRKVSLFLLVFSGLLALVFFALINNTIRISIYSQRFIINTMQLVGATRSYIRKPFLKRSIIIGLYGAGIAFVLILLLVYSYQDQMNGVLNLGDINTLAIVFLIILISGLFLSWFSAYLSVNKFLKMKFDELFY
jgi:cell division transport system permease protein